MEFEDRCVRCGILQIAGNLMLLALLLFSGGPLRRCSDDTSMHTSTPVKQPKVVGVPDDDNKNRSKQRHRHAGQKRPKPVGFTPSASHGLPPIPPAVESTVSAGGGPVPMQLYTR